MRPFHVGAIEDLIHPVDYGLLESSDDLLGIFAFG
jgi:hypothetical protein